MKEKIAEAEEVARILRQNIVQGRQLEDAEKGDQRYRAYPKSHGPALSMYSDKDGAARSGKGC